MSFSSLWLSLRMQEVMLMWPRCVSPWQYKSHFSIWRGDVWQWRSLYILTGTINTLLYISSLKYLHYTTWRLQPRGLLALKTTYYHPVKHKPCWQGPWNPNQLLCTLAAISLWTEPSQLPGIYKRELCADNSLPNKMQMCAVEVGNVYTLSVWEMTS